jgi:hypothetical protein
MEFEGIRLTYEHFISSDGKKYPLEEPIYVQTYFIRGQQPSSYVLNDVLRKMEDKLLSNPNLEEGIRI